MKLTIEVEVPALEPAKIMAEVEKNVRATLQAAVSARLNEMERFFHVDESALRSRWESAWQAEVARMAAEAARAYTVTATIAKKEEPPHAPETK